jgi:hypothetical protein
MPVSLGRDGGSPTGSNGATGIMSVTWTQEVNAIDVSHRGLVSASGISYKAATGGFVTRTAEIECLDATAVMASLAGAGTGYIVTNVTENRSLDDKVTFTLTAKKTS